MLRAGLAFFGKESRAATGPTPPVWRRLFHLTVGSSIPVAGIFAPEQGMLIALAVVSVGGLGLDLARFRLSWLNRQFLRWLAPLLKYNEGRRFTGATYLVVAGLLAFLFFGAAVAVPVMLFLSLGDPVAALAGRRMRGPRFLGKSPAGTAGFIAVSFAVVGVLVGGNAIEFHSGLLVGAVIAGLVELASLPPDDNVAVPLVAGAAMHFLGV